MSKQEELNALGNFIKKKIALLDEDDPWSRASCARLRRAIGKKPGSSPDTWDVMLSEARNEWRSDDNYDASPYEWAAHTALTLYALHKQGKTESMNSYKDSFASAAAQLATIDKENKEAIRRRFNIVATSADYTELTQHARSVVRMLKAADVPMNYPKFAQDLALFQFPGKKEKVRLRWGEDFYRIFDKIKKEDEE